MNSTAGLKPNPEQSTDNRNVWTAIGLGIRSRCPSCGVGKLFAAKLSIVDECDNCGEELHHHRADDLPAYLNILFVGHIVVGVMMVVMAQEVIDLWPLTFLTVFIAVSAAVLLMRPLKGLVVGAQWAMRMHGFGGDHD